MTHTIAARRTARGRPRCQRPHVYPCGPSWLIQYREDAPSDSLPRLARGVHGPLAGRFRRRQDAEPACGPSLTPSASRRLAPGETVEGNRFTFCR